MFTLIGSDTSSSCAGKCNRDRRCLSFTYWEHVNKCYTKNASHATGARVTHSEHSEWYNERCVDRPQPVNVVTPPRDDGKDREIKEMKAEIIKQCRKARRDEQNCSKTCLYEYPKNAEIDQLKCKL